jgi:hypothetical protein
MDEQNKEPEPVRVYTEQDSLCDILRAIIAKEEARTLARV